MIHDRPNPNASNASEHTTSNRTKKRYTVPIAAPTNARLKTVPITHPTPFAFTLTPAFPYPLPDAPVSFFAVGVLKHSNIGSPFSYSPSVLIKQPCTKSGSSVVQNWKQPSSVRVFELEPGGPYVTMALTWPLQHVSRIEEFEPPIGTAQDASAVGGLGIWLALQDIMIVDCVAYRLKI